MPRHMNGKHGSSIAARPKGGPRPTLPPGGRIGVPFAQNYRHTRDADLHRSEVGCAHPGSGAVGCIICTTCIKSIFQKKTGVSTCLITKKHCFDYFEQLVELLVIGADLFVRRPVSPLNYVKYCFRVSM